MNTTPRLSILWKGMLLVVAFLSWSATSLPLSAAPDTVLTSPVGPRPPGEYEGTPEGFLIVYSATELKTNGDTYYYPHSSYDVFQNGKRVKSVTNHMSILDESPEKASLPPGRYTVVAESEKDGEVSIPVIIETAHTTVLHLEKGYASEQMNNTSNKVVRSPSGQVIGWKAS